MNILRIFFILLLTAVSAVSLQDVSHSKEFLLYSFERDPQGWEIPDWAFGKNEYVAKQMGISEFHTSDGRYSLEVSVDFVDNKSWEGAYVERIVDVTDWTPFSFLSADIFLPKEAPQGLRGKMILTIGDDWKWTEMNRSIPLTPGEWTVIKVDLTSKSTGWRRFVDDDFRRDVRKLGIRVESNGKVVYNGPVYIDNVRLTD
jgi:Carbohydrate binding module 27